jgi:signal transduction histidine kinase
MTSTDAPTDDAPTSVVPVPAGSAVGSGRRSLRASLRERTRFAISGIRTRVLVSYIALLAASIAVAIVALFQVLEVRLADDIDSALAQEVEELRALAAGVNPATGEQFGEDAEAIFDTFFVRSVPGEYEVFYSIVDGAPYKRTLAPASLFDVDDVVETWSRIREPTWGDTDTTAGPVRWLAVPLTGADRIRGVFAVAHYAAEQRAQNRTAIHVMILVSFVVLLLASALAWIVAGRAIAPLRTLTASARGIGERDLSARIPVDGTDEVAELTATLNSMLERLESAFASQRDFLNDVGHELRTPITIIRGHLELLDEDPTERRRTIDLVLDELDRMGRYVADLLLIARAEQPDFLRLEPLELAEFIDGLAARVRPLGDRAWVLVPIRPTVIVADADRLTQAMVNLAANAARHTPPGAVIEIGAAVEGEYARLWVRDEGTGIAPADQERIFERFARGRDRLTGSSDGTGLGLAIVDAIAAAHGGRTELESTIGRGSTFRIVIPLTPRSEVPPT